MSMVRTKKGTELPLLNLKGKDYLQVCYRVQWFVEENPHYDIEVSHPTLTPTETVSLARISILDDQSRVVRRAVGTKRETQKHFQDHTEKSETGAIGRALALLGYGTQYAQADLDEGQRIVDSPQSSTRPTGQAPSHYMQTGRVAPPQAARHQSTEGVYAITSKEIKFGKYKSQTYGSLPLEDLISYGEWLKGKAAQDKKPLSTTAEEFLADVAMLQMDVEEGPHRDFAPIDDVPF